uniref:Uncharacterized protein n=1 Tax=Palpitomonas bilix TaxID=652834 RepID=A0A7S3D2L3_9EUKA
MVQWKKAKARAAISKTLASMSRQGMSSEGEKGLGSESGQLGEEPSVRMGRADALTKKVKGLMASRKASNLLQSLGGHPMSASRRDGSSYGSMEGDILSASPSMGKSMLSQLELEEMEEDRAEMEKRREREFEEEEEKAAWQQFEEEKEAMKEEQRRREAELTAEIDAAERRVRKRKTKRLLAPAIYCAVNFTCTSHFNSSQ